MHFPKLALTGSYISGNQDKFMLYTFLNRFLFSEEKQYNLLQVRVFSGIQLIPYIKSTYHYIAAGVIRHLHVYLQIGSSMLTYLICPSVQNFFIGFRKLEPVSHFRLNTFLIMYGTGGLTGKFQGNRFIKTGFLLGAFYCIILF